MKDTLDEGIIQGKSKKYAKRAMIRFSGSILCYLALVLVIVQSSVISATVVKVVGGMSLLTAFLALSGLILSIKAFKRPKENGLLKYIALVGNGLIIVVMLVIIIGNYFDLWRRLF